MKTLVFGDSISWGAYDYKNGGWVELLKRVGLKNDDFVYNLSIDGNTSGHIIYRIMSEMIIRVNPKDFRIIFAFGANDAGRYENRLIVPKDDFEQNIIGIIDQVQMHTDKIYFIGLTPVDDSKTNPVEWDSNLAYKNSDMVIYNNKLKRTVEGDGRANFIDIFDLLNNSDLEDGIHPNTKGHKKIFDRIYSALNK